MEIHPTVSSIALGVLALFFLGAYFKLASKASRSTAFLSRIALALTAFIAAVLGVGCMTFLARFFGFLPQAIVWPVLQTLFLFISFPLAMLVAVGALALVHYCLFPRLGGTRAPRG